MSENKNSERIIRKPLKKSERKKKSRRKALVIAFSMSLFFAVYGYFLYSVRSSFVSEIVTPSLLETKVRKEVDGLLGLTYFYFLPNNSWLTPSLFPLEHGLKARVPEIETISVTRSLLSRSLSVSYTLRTPVLRLAGGEVVDTHNNHYLDDRNLVLPLLVTDEKISSEDLTKLIFLKDTIETALFPIDEIDIDAARDVTLVLRTEAKTKILFSLRQNEKDVWSKIVSAFETSPLKENKESFARVLSLDARFGNKIYYKMKVGDGDIIPESTATTTYERQ